MKDPLTGSTYQKVYQDLKNISKTGESFIKSLMSTLQQRSNLELSYAKGLEKVANKLTKALENNNKNCINNAWTCASEEMRTTAEVHKKLGTAILAEAIKPTNQVLEEHDKRRKKLDNEVEKMANSVLHNWKQQIKVKKKLMDHTKKHEALFHHAENGKESANEKDKQKLLNKLKKSTELLIKIDDEYYKENVTGQAIRLKWENVLENCYKSIQDLEKEKIQLLSQILTRYNQHVLTFGQTLNKSQTQIDQAIKSIDVEKDIQTFLEETTIYSEDNKSEFLLLDYYEEDGSCIMDKDRRVASLEMKTQRIQQDIEKASRDKEGLEKMMKAYTENPAFSDLKNEDDTSLILEETNLKLNLLEANNFKLALALAELQKKPLPKHPCSECITKWKEKGCQHCSVHISRSINMQKIRSSNSKRTPTRQSSNLSSKVANEYENLQDSTDHPQRPPRGSGIRLSKDQNNLVKADLSTPNDETGEQDQGSYLVLYPYEPQRQDELSLKKDPMIKYEYLHGSDTIIQMIIL
ncbi:nostrin isoform X2 [Bombina bombina]|uniref:nostrin isoform X2 n=1 Tax=Bombina bombina TaxID=8345 RepID=UPI00235A5A4D|nr:nostrin isoform X2 [Bombina bombina]